MDLYSFLTIVGSVIVFVGSMTWWLALQFSSLRTLVYSQIKEVRDTIIAKLEYHEKHDDKRFDNIRNDIWDIRVRNAARDGLTNLDLRKNDQEAYNRRTTGTSSTS
jgi:hypothetical protein